MTDHLITSDIMSLLRGRRSFAAGEPCPPDIWTDEEWRGKCNDEMLFRLGWQLERAAGMISEKRAREYQEALRAWAEDGAPLPQYPK